MVYTARASVQIPLKEHLQIWQRSQQEEHKEEKETGRKEAKKEEVKKRCYAMLNKKRHLLHWGLKENQLPQKDLEIMPRQTITNSSSNGNNAIPTTTTTTITTTTTTRMRRTFVSNSVFPNNRGDK